MRAEYTRPDPDELLARIKAEEQYQGRGKLKIFLGYAAGVGKTYAMLEAAQQRKAEGVDVIVGYAETHGRKETDAYLDGLEILPHQQLKYRGKTFSELDLDAVLARKPQLVLIDELAHTNPPGLRHPKRYQDVDEILSMGIDVYTTVNVQHLESLNDVIQQITGVVVKETVPDRLIDDAYEIELIDLPANELIQRLHDGKVYVPDQALHALESFFRKGNLTALRELSLRRVADRVDNQMLDYMQTKSIPGPWPAGERILVCISSHPMGEKLIRVGRRLADDINAEWSVMFVETPGHLRMSVENRTRVQRNLNLAEELGAVVVKLTGNSVADTVIHYARDHNITKIIAGKTFRPRWLEIVQSSVLDELIRHSGKIDVYVVSGSTVAPQITKQKSLTSRSPFRDYIFSLTLVFLATVTAKPLEPYLDPTNLVMLYLLAVILAAIFLGRWPAILASFVSVFTFDFFYVEPHLSFSVTDTQYLITFGGLLLVGLVISNSAAVLRNKVDILRIREQQAEALNILSRELTGAVSLEDVLNIVHNKVKEMFNREVVILLPENERLIQRVSTPGFTMAETELAVAEWAFKKGQAAGRGTDTLTAATIRYLPLKTARGTVGVLGVRPQDPQDVLSIDQRMLLEGFVNLAALAIERASLAERIAQTEMLQKTEILQTALLNSISHEFRTPLASITGVLTSLGESEKSGNRSEKLDPTTRRELIESATQQARRLNHLVENLLDMTRLEAGAVRLNHEPGDMEDLVGTVLNQMSERLSDHLVNVSIPHNFPLVPMDIVLIAQVMTNLLDNASKYSAPGSSIDIIVASNGDQVTVSVRDFGSGIPTKDLQHVFDKFYRVHQQNQVAGTGLGLSICKGIIEAHGGKIWAENNKEKGVTVTFTLPILLIALV